MPKISLDDLSVPFGMWCEDHGLTHKQCPECGVCVTYEAESLRKKRQAEQAYIAHIVEKHPELNKPIRDWKPQG